MGCKNNVHCIKKDGNNVTSQLTIGTLFGEFFQSTFIDDNGTLPPVWPKHFFLSSDSLPVLTPREMIKIIRKLNGNCGPGPDGIPAVFVKNCAATLSYPLSVILNLSLSSGTIPDAWRTSVVTPIHKGGDKGLVQHYRGIAKSSIFCKVSEIYVRDLLQDFLISNDLISQTQHGFLSGRSVTTNLLCCKNDWTRNLDSGKNTTVAYLDYSKAFDSVSHPKLIHKLRHEFCIPKPLISWIESFLHNRSYRVKIGDALSGAFPVRSGVPQGSVIGPLLFLLYVNGLGDKVSSATLSTYADDTKVYLSVSCPSDATVFQNQLDTVSSWSKTWLLAINFLKSFILQIGPVYQHVYNINQNNLEVMTSARDLGVQITSKLSDHEHCTIVTRKANLAIRNIKLCFFDFNNRTFYLTLYTTYVRPILETAMQVFSPGNIGDIDLIESVQRRFTRSLLGNPDLSYSERLITLVLQPLEIRRIFGDIVLLARVIRGRTKLDFYQFLELAPRSGRGHSVKLQVQYSRTNVRKNFWSNRVVGPWNSLSQQSLEKILSGIHPATIDDFDVLPFCRGSWTR